MLFTSTGELLRFPASAVRPQGRSAAGVTGVRLAAGAGVVGFSAVPLTGADTLFDEPVVVTGEQAYETDRPHPARVVPADLVR